MELAAQVTTPDVAVPFLAKAAEHDTSGGLLTMRDICHDVQFMQLEADGKVVGAYAVKLVNHERGKVLWLQSAAANVPGVELGPLIFNIVEKQARMMGADQVAVTTIRKGGMKKLRKLGYEMSGVTFRKNLK